MADDEMLEDCGIEELYGTALAPRTEPPTEHLWRSKMRTLKDRLELLHRAAPEEFYERKQIIERAIKEREEGKEANTMPYLTLDELKELVRFIERLYR